MIHREPQPRFQRINQHQSVPIDAIKHDQPWLPHGALPPWLPPNLPTVPRAHRSVRMAPTRSALKALDEATF